MTVNDIGCTCMPQLERVYAAAHVLAVILLLHAIFLLFSYISGLTAL